jgi:potassium efflux system protein
VIILPNRKFISEEVINWTHNDQIIRTTIDVGVAYGTDVARVREVLFEILEADPLVRKDPEPRAWFLAFGDSTLNVRIHAFTDYENRLRLTNDLNLAIARRFTEEGIEIAFPQRDLHLRTVEDPAVLEALGRKSPEVDGAKGT